KTVVFGGWNETIFFSDTWLWDGNTWTLGSTSGPSPRWGPGMCYDRARSVVVLFGGIAPAGAMNDTWEWNGTRWTQIPIPGPGIRGFTSLVYDSARQVSVLFGGTNGGPLPGDTWEYNGTTWVQRFPQSSPPARYVDGMAYDVSRQRTVLF